MTYKFTGSKFERGIDVKDIAKLVRTDIKEAIKKGELPKGTKVSVRISRFSGGRSISAYIKHLGEKGVINPAWVKWHDENPHGYHGDGPPLYTATATQAIKTIEGIMAAYNFDDSDSQVDYFHVNFYGHVEFDYDYRQADEALTRREGFYPDLSEKGLEKAAAEGKLLTCTGNDDCSICTAFKQLPAPPKPIQSYPIFNRREAYRC
jgi:hypothetical protein